MRERMRQQWSAVQKPRSVLLRSTLLAACLSWSTQALAGTYLNAAALLLDENRRAVDWLQRHVFDSKLADVCEQLADARVKAGRTLNVPIEADPAHPHLLLTLEIAERAMAAAAEGQPVRSMRLIAQAREEERAFRTFLAQLKLVLPELDRNDKKP